MGVSVQPIFSMGSRRQLLLALAFCSTRASAEAQARQQRPGLHPASMTEDECAECVLSDAETVHLKEAYATHASREQRMMLCAPMFDHVFGDFDAPTQYERVVAFASGFSPTDERPADHVQNPGYCRFKLRYQNGRGNTSNAKIQLPYLPDPHVHSIEVCDTEERFARAWSHVWLTRAGELPVDLAACGGAVGIGVCDVGLRTLEADLDGHLIGPTEFFALALQAAAETLLGIENPGVTYRERSVSLRNLAFLIHEGHRLLGRANDCRRVLGGLALLLSPYEHLVATWLYEQAVMPVGPTRGLCMHKPPVPAEDGGGYSCSRPMNQPVLPSLHPTFLNPMAYLAPPPRLSHVLWSSEHLQNTGPEPLFKHVCFHPETQLVRPFGSFP
jgi:hypothetical protein